ncbi:hypothetical protein F5Y14DRAFT_291831 [Nemania sp. NC0429]|nr:hypothetical protein F5Y14DRAFT_291831 [Nemania sp. NC0429]
MPRILPWKRREQAMSKIPTSARSSPVQRVKRENAERVRDESDSHPSSDSGATTKKPVKRPHLSTPTPPEERSMIEGIDGDDRYRMVEDEFLATARQFTAHLHAAEYERLKAASERENAQTIQNISRPVVGKMTELVRTKQERNARGEKQRLAAKKLRKGDADDSGSDDDDGDGSWQKQSLYGLMESPGKRAGRLHGLPSATSITRAAAGYNRQTSDPVSPSRTKTRVLSDVTRRTTHEVEDGKGAPRSHSVAARTPQRASAVASRVTEPEPRQVDKPASKTSHNSTGDLQNDKKRAAEGPAGSDEEDMDFIARLKKRQAERKRSREQRKSTTSSIRKVKSDLDDILPDFL